MSRLVPWIFLASIIVCLAPSLAWAQPSDADRATARALAREGYEAQKHARYDLAADRFQRAEALVHAPTLLLGLARAQVGLGKLVEAHETYERIARETLSPSSPAPFVKALEDAKREAAVLTPRLAWVTLDVHGPSTAEVFLDDALVPAAALGVKRACDPGQHRVKAAVPGLAAIERTFAVDEGATQTVSLSIESPVESPPPVAVAPAPAEPPPAAGRTESTSSIHTSLAIFAMGVGVSGLIVGGVTGVLALNKHASLDSDCPNGHCSADEGGAVDAYRTLANVSTVATILGVAGAATGITLMLTTPKPSSVTAYAGVLGAGIQGAF